MGSSEESSRDELRQIEPLPALLLRKRNHAEGGRREVKRVFGYLVP